MFTRKLSWFAAAFVLGLATTAWADGAQYTAELIAQRGDQMAMGRAVWQSQGRPNTLIVFVDRVFSTDHVMVVVDNRYVGEFDIVDGSGMLIVSNQQTVNPFPSIHAGSKVVVYAGDSDRPILYGAFRAR